MRLRPFTTVLGLALLATFTLTVDRPRAIDPYLLVMAKKLAPNKATHQEKLYISNEQSNTLTVVDVATNKVINTIEIGGCWKHAAWPCCAAVRRPLVRGH